MKIAGLNGAQVTAVMMKMKFEEKESTLYHKNRKKLVCNKYCICIDDTCRYASGTYAVP